MLTFSCVHVVMDASQLIRIRMEKAQKYVARAQPTDSSMHTYRTMIQAASGGCPAPTPRTSGVSGQAATPGFVEQYSSRTAEPAGTVVTPDGTYVTRYQTLAAEGHLRLGSQGSGSLKYSGDSVAYRNAGRAECTGPAPNGTPLALPTPGCDDNGVYAEPGRYDPAHPDSRLLVPAPCGIPQVAPHYVTPPCTNDGTSIYLNGAWSNIPNRDVVYPLPPSG
jgi:hypothetical protein